MVVKMNLSRCRVCLKSIVSSSLNSLFEGNGKRAEKFQIVSGIDISIDKGKRDALICFRCWKEVQCAYTLREKMTRAENLYFALGRTEFEVEYLEELLSPERPKTQHVEVIHNEEKKTLDYVNTRIKREPSVEFELEIPMDDEENTTAGGTELYIEESGKKVADQGETKPKSAKVPAKCNQNRKESRTKSQVKKPEKRSKKLQQSFQCSTCTKVLTTKTGLQKHIEAIHEKKTRFQCSQCLRCFKYEFTLASHILDHNKGNDCKLHTHPFKCNADGCDKSFMTKKSLMSHQNAHEDSRQFMCICGQKFERNRQLKSHQQKARHIE